MNSRYTAKLILAVFATLAWGIMWGCGTANARDNVVDRSDLGVRESISDSLKMGPKVQQAGVDGWFGLADLVGDWNVILHDNAQNGFNWTFVKMRVDESGNATCLFFTDGDGQSTCVDLPALSILPNGTIISADNLYYGIMSEDKATVFLTKIDSGQVFQTGMMTKAFDDFNAQHLIGTWTAFLTSGVDNTLTYVKMSVNEFGETACLQYYNPGGDTQCPTLPNLTINPNGLIDTGTGVLYGLMNYYGDFAELVAVRYNRVTYTGVLTKVYEGFTSEDLEGQWSVFLLENGARGYGWNYLTMSVDDEGDATCLTRAGDRGLGCSDPLPQLAISPNGIITTSDNTVLGIMKSDSAGARLFGYENGKVVQTGAMMRIF